MARTLTKRNPPVRGGPLYPNATGKRSTGNQTEAIIQDMLSRMPQDSEDPRSVALRAYKPLPRVRGAYVSSKRSKLNPPV